MDVDGYLAQHEDRLIASLAEFISIASVSTTGSDMTPAIEFLLDELAAAGLDGEVLETEGNPVVYAEGGPPDPAFELLIYGHYDVFPGDERDAWRTPPFEPTVYGDRIYGRGAGDNKGQILAQIAAVRLISEAGGGLRGKVKILIEGEEEIGSKSLPQVVSDHRGRLGADLCFYSDGPMFPGDQPVVLFGVRGFVLIELTATGAERVVHSGNFGGVVPAPAMDLCRLLASLVDADGRILVAGLEEGVSAPSEAERAAIAKLADPVPGFRAELGVQPRVTGAEFYESLMLRPYLNIAGIESGSVAPGVRPIVPKEASAKLELRLVGDQDPERVVDAIREHAERHGFGDVSLRPIVGQPASRTPLDHPLASIVQSAVTAGFGTEPLLVPALGATTPEYVFTKLLGLPTFAVPFAPYDESNHAPNESTRISLFLGGIRTTAALLGALPER